MLPPLLQAAFEARSRAYAPYSGYAVGAAVEAEDGSVYRGCNVENISYGLTICAERNAVGQMVAGGRTRLRRVAVATADGGTPCGMCLQTLLEFAEDPEAVEVVAADDAGRVQAYRLRELMPHAFNSAAVHRTERTPK